MQKQFSRLAGLTRRMTVWATPTVGMTMGSSARQFSQIAADADVTRLLHIPVLDTTPDDEACARLRDQGQFLARQDRWGELARQIAEAERDRSKAPGGMPISDLLSFGARADVVAAAEHAIQEDVPAGSPTLLAGIEALETVLREERHDPAIALIVAQAHIDIGWAWRGADAERDVPTHRRSAFAAHFDRARTILDRFDAAELDSPALAAARCAILPGLRDQRMRIADAYERLIDLDPANERHMRALGNHLLPRWFGDYEQLELEARRTAARTQHVWGHAGYTWVMFDAIANDHAACVRVDADFFIDGLRDILSRRPDQATANLLAAYCSVALRGGAGGAAAARITACADWVIRDHMTELHPLIWAHATEGFNNAAPVTSLNRFAAHGQAHALDVLGDLFREDIAGGRQVVFTPDGPQIST